MLRRHAILLLVAALFLGGCAKTPLRQAGQQGESALAEIRGLTAAYQRRDIEGFMDKISMTLPDYAAFRKSVEGVFTTYQTIEFKVQNTRMLVNVQEKGPIRATFTWEGEWRTLGGKIVKDGSRVTLALDPSSFKLVAIDGKNPYVPVETPLPVQQP